MRGLRRVIRLLCRSEQRHRLALLAAMIASWPALAVEPQRLTTDGRLKRDPVFLNPQGTELLYVLHDKPNRLRLMKLSLKDGQSTPLHPDETRSEFEPAVSSDGRYLAYVQNRGNLTLAMVVHDLIENKITELPPGGGLRLSGLWRLEQLRGERGLLNRLRDGRHGRGRGRLDPWRWRRRRAEEIALLRPGQFFWSSAIRDLAFWCVSSSEGVMFITSLNRRMASSGLDSLSW